MKIFYIILFKSKINSSDHKLNHNNLFNLFKAFLLDDLNEELKELVDENTFNLVASSINQHFKKFEFLNCSGSVNK